MSQLPKSVFARLGKMLRARNEHLTRETMPKRWIDLLLHLDEQERRQSGQAPSEAAPPAAEPKDQGQGVQNS